MKYMARLKAITEGGSVSSADGALQVKGAGCRHLADRLRDRLPAQPEEFPQDVF